MRPVGVLSHLNSDPTMSRTPTVWFVAATALLVLVPPAAAQEDTTGTDAYRRAVREAATEAREAIRERGGVFLDTTLSVDRRLQAVEGVSELMASEQVERAKQFVFERKVPTRIRTRALGLTRTELTTDRQFLGRVLELMENPETRRAVRRAAADAVHSMLMSISYLTPEEDPARIEIRTTFRSLLDDDDRMLRRKAFVVLGGRGDSLVVDRLTHGLRNPADVPFDVVENLQLVGPFLSGEALPVVDSIMRNPPNPRARIEAVRLLGGHQPSHEVLYRYLRNGEASLDLRLAAAKSLAPATPDRFLEEATALVRDAEIPSELRIYAVEAIRQQRLTGDAANLTRSPDAFDRAVLSLAENATSDRLRAIARRYLETTYLTHQR